MNGDSGDNGDRYTLDRRMSASCGYEDCIHAGEYGPAASESIHSFMSRVSSLCQDILITSALGLLIAEPPLRS